MVHDAQERFKESQPDELPHSELTEALGGFKYPKEGRAEDGSNEGPAQGYVQKALLLALDQYRYCTPPEWRDMTNSCRELAWEYRPLLISE